MHSVYRFFTIIAALFIATPLVFMLVAWLLPTDNGLGYLIRHGLIFQYSTNSVLIAVLTGFFTLIIGVFTAWAVTMWEFPARRLLSWLLILPFAMPAYVLAMIYSRLLQSAGPVQSYIRETFGVSFGEYYFPEIHSLPGVIFILSICLYPYVYLMARAAFLTQSKHIIETAEMLGLSRRHLFFKLALPLSRPALITGVALVMMEALADYGVVSFFGVPAFTTGIFRLWQGFYDPVAASRLASIMMIIVLAVLWLERHGRGKAHYANSVVLYHPLVKMPIIGAKRWLITLLCLLPIIVGFIAPFAFLLMVSMTQLEIFATSSLWSAAFNSLKLGVITALIATIIGTLFVYALRNDRSLWLSMAVRLATSGYAIPGSIIAVGLLLFLVTLQNDVLDGRFFLTGSILGIVWGCVLRFLTISFNNSEAGMNRITAHMDAAATMLGASRIKILTNIHLPILKANLISGFILVFIDTLKELPATLLLRPFNFNTLAIRSYELAMDDLLSHAAPNALMLVMISLVSIWLLNRQFAKARPGR